jgi:hypothetical protein
VALGVGEELVAALIGELGVQERVHGRRLAGGAWWSSSTVTT